MLGAILGAGGPTLSWSAGGSYVVTEVGETATGVALPGGAPYEGFCSVTSCSRISCTGVSDLMVSVSPKPMNALNLGRRRARRLEPLREWQFG